MPRVGIGVRSNHDRPARVLDPRVLDAVMSETIELRPPTFGKSWRGRELVRELLRFAAESFDILRYSGTLRVGATWVLPFEADLGGKPLSGVDRVRLDDDGRIAVSKSSRGRRGLRSCSSTE